MEALFFFFFLRPATGQPVPPRSSFLLPLTPSQAPTGSTTNELLGLITLAPLSPFLSLFLLMFWCCCLRLHHGH
jgi:hypothetical protein